MKTFTGEEVKQAGLAAGITIIDHHDCSICGYMVSYFILGDQLYFDSGCDCGISSQPTVRTWQEAADWINMQTREDIREKIAARFGLTLQPQGIETFKNTADFENSPNKIS